MTWCCLATSGITSTTVNLLRAKTVALARPRRARHPLMNPLEQVWRPKSAIIHFISLSAVRDVKRSHMQRGPGRSFSQGQPGEKIFEFCFYLNGVFWCTLCFWATAGPSNVVGQRKNFSLPPLDGPVSGSNDCIVFSIMAKLFLLFLDFFCHHDKSWTLHLVRWNFAWACISATARTLLNFKVIRRRS